jgi:hypothetical protein
MVNQQMEFTYMKWFRCQILTGLLIVLGNLPLWGEPGSISIESKVDRAKITIGDRVRYSIIVTHGDSVKVEMPEFGLNLGAFEILDYNDHDPVRQNDQIVQIRDYIISTFDVGEYEIPAVAVQFTVAGDTARKELKTESIKINVESLKPSETGDIRDIKPPFEIERDWKSIIRISAAALAIILIGILIFYFIKRRREGKSLLPMREKPARPSHEVALEALDNLVKSSLLADGELKQFYIQLSDIIRTYVEGRYFIIALEMTTGQLISTMRQSNIESEVIQLIENFLVTCDFVKFAKYRPTQEETDVIVTQAYDIVNTTKLLPQFEATDAAGPNGQASSHGTDAESQSFPPESVQPKQEVETI